MVNDDTFGIEDIYIERVQEVVIPSLASKLFA